MFAEDWETYLTGKCIRISEKMSLTNEDFSTSILNISSITRKKSGLVAQGIDYFTLIWLEEFVAEALAFEIYLM